MNGGAPRCVGALLAGGSGTRMGGAKGAVELAGMSLGMRAATTLRALTAHVVQAGGDAIAGVDLEIIADRRRDAGPAAGIEAVLRRFGLPTVVLAVDLPLVPATLLEQCLHRVEEGADICAPHWRGRWHPLCGAYSPAALPVIGRRLDAGESGLQELLNELGTALSDQALQSLGDPDRLLLNVNTPDDLDRAERLVSA